MTIRALALSLLALSLLACDPKPDTGEPEDADSDGYGAHEDCDDEDPAVNPGAAEACNGIDDDCDGEVDEEVGLTLYTDADGDGYGDPELSSAACEPVEGMVDSGDDCDDSDPELNPGATEICDGIDNDCDGWVDDEDDSLDSSTGSTWYRDADGDGFGDAESTTAACITPDGYTEDATDCDDGDGEVNPDADEVCNSQDDDCDGLMDDQDDDLDTSTATTWFMDVDGDGYGDPRITTAACSPTEGWVGPDWAGDCDDDDSSINPDATEICDEIDNDCDGDIDDDDRDVDSSTGSTWYLDGDGDGYGEAATSLQACAPPTGYCDDSTDCDDNDSSLNPAVTEICDEIDNDCDGLVDDDDDDVDLGTASTWYMDADGDGWSDARVTTWACDAPSGWTGGTMAADCDDDDSSINPDAAETCDGLDNDCDGDEDEGLVGDGELCPAVSCLEILTERPSATDGAYWIDPLASGAYEVLCDMNTDGGGWTLLATGSDDGQNTWTWDARALWDSGAMAFGDIDHPEEDFESPAHAELIFEDLLFMHQPSGIWAEYDAVGNGTQSFAGFLGTFSDSECYAGDDGWPMTAGTLTVTGLLCSTDVFFNAMDNDGGTCSSHDDSAGPAWSAANDAGCPLDDVGHNGFGPNKLYPSTESDASTGTYFGAGYGGAIGMNVGTIGAAENYIQAWAR